MRQLQRGVRRRLAYMSVLTYNADVSPKDKPLVWLSGEVKTPPLTANARVEAGFLLRRLQRGESLEMPQSRPMPTIGTRCHELRIPDANRTWRIIYRIDSDAIVIADVFSKTTQATPKQVIVNSQKRLRSYDEATRGET
jgi:phage-related protein